MDSCKTGDHITGDHIHTEITTCSTEEPQQKYRPGTNGVGWGLKTINLYIVYLPSIYYDLFAETAASNGFAQIVLPQNCK